MFDQKLLGNRIRSLRLKKELSLDKLGELAGLNGKYLGEVERGSSNISVVNLSKLAGVLEVPLQSLLTFGHERPRAELIQDLHQRIEKSNDTQLKTIYRVLDAITR